MTGTAMATIMVNYGSVFGFFQNQESETWDIPLQFIISHFLSLKALSHSAFM